MEIEYFNERVVMSGFGDAVRFYEGESRKSCMICRKNTENTSTTRMLFLRRIGYEVVDFGPLCGACLSGTRSVNLHCGARSAQVHFVRGFLAVWRTTQESWRHVVGSWDAIGGGWRCAIVAGSVEEADQFASASLTALMMSLEDTRE
jgi:hypothetical protein